MKARLTRTRKTSAVRLIGDGLAEVDLTGGFVSKIDESDIPVVARYKWHYKPSHRTGYAVTCEYVPSLDSYRDIPMHRLICGLERGDPRTPDHIDRDGLNNTRANLRIADNLVQCSNKNIATHNTSGVRGVHFTGTKWKARISVGGKRFDLGNYDTFNEAERVRCVTSRVVTELISALTPSLADQQREAS